MAEKYYCTPSGSYENVTNEELYVLEHGIDAHLVSGTMFVKWQADIIVGLLNSAHRKGRESLIEDIKKII